MLGLKGTSQPSSILIGNILIIQKQFVLKDGEGEGGGVANLSLHPPFRSKGKPVSFQPLAMNLIHEGVLLNEPPPPPRMYVFKLVFIIEIQSNQLFSFLGKNFFSLHSILL